MSDRSFELNAIEKEIVINGNNNDNNNDNNLNLGAILAVPENSEGLIIFAHGSGSGRLSPRNNFVARVLQKVNLATLLLDLLTDDEALDRRNVFNIELLAERLLLAKSWASKEKELSKKKIGYFGASTGAGAALAAAAKVPENVFAVVSRGGRPDLAGHYLSDVLAPTLLLVGGRDDIVIDLNLSALEKLNCVKEIKIIPGATHLFEEPGTLEQVALLATEWFQKQL